jgi:ketosteroid isomerase-like protein
MGGDARFVWKAHISRLGDTSRVMSRENIETARQVFDAMNRDDLPAVMEHATADFVFDFSRSRSFDGGEYRRDEMPAFQEAFGGLWESMRWEPEEFIEAPEDRLVTVQTAYMRGRDDIVVPTKGAWLWLFRDGRVARVTFFQERREALEAAGLTE